MMKNLDTRVHIIEPRHRKENTAKDPKKANINVTGPLKLVFHDLIGHNNAPETPEHFKYINKYTDH